MRCSVYCHECVHLSADARACPLGYWLQAVTCAQRCMLGVLALVLGAQKVLHSIAASGGSSSNAGGPGASSISGPACPQAGQQGLAQQLQAALQDLEQVSAAVPPAGEGSTDQDAAFELASLMRQLLERFTWFNVRSMVSH